MKKNIHLFFILLFSASSFAQAPGYMGKKLTIAYGNHFFPAIISANPNMNSGEEDIQFGINYNHCLTAEYILKPRFSMGASYQFFNTAMRMTKSFHYDVSEIDGSYTSLDISYNPKPYKPFMIATKMFGISFKFFHPGSLAPLGKYRKIDLLFLINDVSYNNYAFTQIRNNSYNSGDVVSRTKMGTGFYSYKTMAIAFTFGKQRVLFDRIIIDYGCRIGIVPQGLLSALVYDDDNPFTVYTDGNGNSFELYTKRNTHMRLFAHELFNFRIGLGFLAF